MALRNSSLTWELFILVHPWLTLFLAAKQFDCACLCKSSPGGWWPPYHFTGKRKSMPTSDAIGSNSLTFEM